MLVLKGIVKGGRRGGRERAKRKKAGTNAACKKNVVKEVNEKKKPRPGQSYKPV